MYWVRSPRERIPIVSLCIGWEVLWRRIPIARLCWVKVPRERIPIISYPINCLSFALLQISIRNAHETFSSGIGLKHVSERPFSTRVLNPNLFKYLYIILSYIMVSIQIWDNIQTSYLRQTILLTHSSTKGDPIHNTTIPIKLSSLNSNNIRRI